MAKKQKKGNYSIDDRKMILEAAISREAGQTISEKQVWLMSNGVHRPGVPGEFVSESAIKYWGNLHKKITMLNENVYHNAMEKLLNSPPSYRKLKEGVLDILSGSVEAELG